MESLSKSDATTTGFGGAFSGRGLRLNRAAVLPMHD